MQPLRPPGSVEAYSDLPTIIRRRASFSQRPTTSSTTTDSIAYTHEGRSPSVRVEQRSPLMDVDEYASVAGRRDWGSGVLEGYGLGLSGEWSGRGTGRGAEEIDPAGSSSGTSSPSLYSPRAQHLQPFANDSAPAWGAMATRDPGAAYHTAQPSSTSRSATPMNVAPNGKRAHGEASNGQSGSEAEKYRALMASPAPSSETSRSTASSPINFDRPNLLLDVSNHPGRSVRPSEDYHAPTSTILDLSTPSVTRGMTPPPALFALPPREAVRTGAETADLYGSVNPERPPRRAGLDRVPSTGSALQPPASPVSPTYSSSHHGSPDAKRMSIMEGPKLRKYSFSAPWEDAQEVGGSMGTGIVGRADGGEKGVLIVGRKSSSSRDQQEGSDVEARGKGGTSKEPTMIWNDVLSGSFLSSSTSSKGTPSKISEGLFGGSTSSASVMGMGLGGRFHLRNPFGGGNASITASDSVGSTVRNAPPVVRSKSRRPGTASSASSGGSKFTLKGIGALGTLGNSESGRKVSTGTVTSRRNTMITPGQSISDGVSPVKSLHSEGQALARASERGGSTGAESLDSVGSIGSLVRGGAYAVFTSDTPPSEETNLQISSSRTSANTDNLSAYRFDDPPGTTNSMISISTHARQIDSSPPRSKSSRFSRLSMSPSKSARAISVATEPLASDGTGMASDDMSGITPMTEVQQVVPVRKSPSAQKLVNLSTGESEVQLEQAVNLMMGSSGTISRGRSSQQLALNNMGEQSVASDPSVGSHSRNRSRTMTTGPTSRPAERRIPADGAILNRSTMYAVTSLQQQPQTQLLHREASGITPGAPAASPSVEKFKPLKAKRSGIMRLFGKDSKRGGKVGNLEAGPEVGGGDRAFNKENTTDDHPEMPPSAAEMIKQAYESATVDPKQSRAISRVPLRETSTPAMAKIAAGGPIIGTPSASRLHVTHGSLATPRRGGKIVRSNSETSPKKSAPHLGKVRPISMMFPDMQGSPHRLNTARTMQEATEPHLTVATERVSSSQLSLGETTRPRPARTETQESFSTARSEMSSGAGERAQEIYTVELLQNQLVNARKAWHIQIIELEAQIRDLKRGVEEAREEQLKRLDDGSCPHCGCGCKAEQAARSEQREVERLSSETARTAGFSSGAGGGSILNRGRAITGGARGVFGTGDLKQWS